LKLNFGPLRAPTEKESLARGDPVGAFGEPGENAEERPIRGRNGKEFGRQVQEHPGDRFEDAADGRAGELRDWETIRAVTSDAHPQGDTRERRVRAGGRLVHGGIRPPRSVGEQDTTGAQRSAANRGPTRPEKDDTTPRWQVRRVGTRIPAGG